MTVWACGVTTVPQRRHGLLPRTLEAIANAGFPPPRLFIDGCQPTGETGYRGEFRLETTAHWPALGVVGNWLGGLQELCGRAPFADWYALFQDDIALCRNARNYIERNHIPAARWLNLVTHPSAKDYLAPLAPAGANGLGLPSKLRGANSRWFDTRPLHNSKPLPNGCPRQAGKGACALCFPRAVAQALLAGPLFTDRLNGLDGAIVEILNMAGYQEMAHVPSLGIHRGATSTTLGSKPQRVSDDFPGEAFDALDLL